ncbi:P-loop containing nucleoside triphosphate hydrolase protein [Crepidotus variabilis]|uniref:RNA helicase n=1 Tax=Crepidotus variabilis TaxID=179855 RepID=A0A9P6E6X8_9AGAR|nr:P-loop containing nucleoside triphosphate hydrolase protein [Crepidotus variabilis]
MGDVGSEASVRYKLKNDFSHGSTSSLLQSSRNFEDYGVSSSSPSRMRRRTSTLTLGLGLVTPTHNGRIFTSVRTLTTSPRCLNAITSGPGSVTPSPIDYSPPSSSASFKSLGIEASIVAALRRAFPNVKRPTEVQDKLIKELIGGRDILLKDDTGSGKSFGLVLGLLTKPRMVIEDEDSNGEQKLKRVTTSLFIVPHRDLAYQLHHWIERIVSELEPSPPLNSIVQVLVRGEAKPQTQLIQELKDTPPHILICTPQAFLDMHKTEEGREALQLDTLSTVVVDEVDYLVPTAARKDPNKSFRKAYEKAVKKIMMHPGPTREILNEIYKRRIEMRQHPYDPDEEGEEKGRWNSTEEWRNDMEAEEEIPQLVLSSATLRVHLKNYLFEESGWLNGYNLAKIVAKNGVFRVSQQTAANPVDEMEYDYETLDEPAEVPVNDEQRKRWNAAQKRGNILHSILVVSDTGVTNVEGAAIEQAASEVREAEGETKEAEEASEESDEDPKEYYHEKYDSTESPFNPISMEAIASAFAVDVPSVGLLVIPSSAPLQRAVYELRTMGVNAHGLDLLKERRGKDYLLQNADVRRANPTLLVATLATTRGLDLPTLTHVFVLGVPEGPSVTGRTVDAYLHIAGRVGRFGRSGRVISVVEEHESAKMVRVLDTLRKKPVQFEQII